MLQAKIANAYTYTSPRLFVAIGCFILSLFVVLVLAYFIHYNNESEAEPAISLKCNVRDVERINGGVVVTGTLVVTNCLDQPIHLGQQSVLSMTYLSLDDVETGEGYYINLTRQ